tara:strand:+ start:29051 stop:29710 length:660 start_codon:yes stop_codon:yes gene_type:complete
MRLIRASDSDWEEQWEDEVNSLEHRLGRPIAIDDSRSRMDRQRRVLIAITMLLVITIPIMQYLMPAVNAYVLSAAMAFTIGTNLTIFIISTQIEDKADKMERKIESLLDELDRAATGLDNFHSELSSVNIPAIVSSIERAREEMRPNLERLQGVSWEQLSEAMDNLFDFWDSVNKDKLNNFISPFLNGEVSLVPAPTRTFEDYDEYLPDLDDDEFMPGL